jgi:hypothetical protein
VSGGDEAVEDDAAVEEHRPRPGAALQVALVVFRHLQHDPVEFLGAVKLVASAKPGSTDGIDVSRCGGTRRCPLSWENGSC